MSVKTAAAYIRVSDPRQDEFSPDSQLRLIRDFAAKNGWLIPEELIFYDDGISGASARRRTAFNDMIALAKQKDPPFSAILVWKFSRFARNQEESIVYKNLLKKNGVAVISVSEPISDDPFGGLIERIIEWMDEYYLIRLGPEVRRGMTEKVSRGQPVTKPPFGYVLDKNARRYAPDPETAPIVKEIFRRFVDGEGMKAIAVSLNARGVRSLRGNPLDNRGIEYILHNPTYVGKLRWCTDGRKASLRDYDYSGDNCIVVDGEHEPLITQEQFDAAQARIAEIKSRYGKFQRREQPKPYMLKGLVRCSACGSTLVLVNASHSPSLQCHRYNRGQCHESHHVNMRLAETAVIDGLRRVADGMPAEIAPPAASSADHAAHKTEDLTKQKDATARKLSRLTDGYLAGAFTVDQYKQLKAAIETELAALTAELAAAAASASALDASAPALLQSRVRDVLNVVSDPESSPETAAEALRSVLTSVTFHRSPAPSFDLHFHL